MDAPQPADGMDPSNVPSPESNPEEPSAAQPVSAARVGLNRNELSGEDFLAANGIAQLIVVDSTGSTNADLLQGVAVDPHAWPDLSVLTAEHQTAARGRLDRHWEAPPLSSVSVSVVLRPVNSDGRPLPTHSYSWFSLLAALALREALLETAGIPAEIKWPNDVMVRGRKIAGILAQLGPMGDGTVPPVILGTGLNVTLTAAELPVPTATSVLLESARTVDRTTLLKSYLSRFASLYRNFCNADGDPAAGMAGGPSLHKRVEAVMSTLGKQVRAQLPGDHEIIGHASRLDEYGSLLVVDAGKHEHVVTAGDVVHLRPWTPPGAAGSQTGTAESGYA
ncbi:biotin--[acetyl-CoA-carboxylase] ligase [Arthrobacter oryzae]|jgi:BirA family biotin operon repressor/biotin-[acetyl-CoA-carboxylase] ligase|uniref:biotin--[acetyl-CoA-carboxylase] ligase n=1 Tax=Arthrobacter oryzae TaxID=409290 RepID=UPI0027820D03|nr:biotin--[acetyl-CoA-carboxylase] ligase [Arthrobacter oryzae]MDQ0077198.1 BirA family biotin operon repressor/biotin-[acetyl-CoA-carboxylase] ligase [Arthrobacter oryzae]